MILILPILYLVAMFLLDEIPFNPKWCLILIAIGGVYDLLRKLIGRIGLKYELEIYKQENEKMRTTSLCGNPNCGGCPSIEEEGKSRGRLRNTRFRLQYTGLRPAEKT